MLSAVVDCGGGWLRSQAPWPSPRRTDGTLPRSASLSPRMPGLSRRPSRLVGLHHPRLPSTPPATARCVKHDAAAGRCTTGQQPSVGGAGGGSAPGVCMPGREERWSLPFFAQQVVALAPPSVVTASHPAAIATATPEEQCGTPPPVPCTGTSHQQPPMHRCALCLRLRARGAAGGLRNRGRRHRLAARPAAIATEARQRARRHPPRLSPL